MGRRFQQLPLPHTAGTQAAPHQPEPARYRHHALPDLPQRSRGDVSARDYLTRLVRESDDQNTSRVIARVASESGVPYSTIYRYLMIGGGISGPTAVKLVEWGAGKIDLAATLSR